MRKQMKRWAEIIVAAAIVVAMLSGMAQTTKAADTYGIDDTLTFGTPREAMVGGHMKNKHAFEMPETGILTVTTKRLKTATTTVFTELHEANGRLIHKQSIPDSDLISDTSPKDTRTYHLRKGSYYFVMDNGFADSTLYSIAISFTPEKETFSDTSGNGDDDRMEGANAVALNTKVNGQIAANDKDYYKINVTQAGKLTVSFTYSYSNFTAELLNASGETVAGYANGLDTSGSLQKEAEVTPGTYYLHVYPRYGFDAMGYTYANACNGEYSFTLSMGSDTPTPKKFFDVPSGSYYEKAVDWAVDKGITTGTDATHFAPNQVCTRGQAVTFLYRYYGSPAVSGLSPFHDVARSSSYYNAVLWASLNGITDGLSKTVFGLNDPCTRAQIVTFLWRAAGKPSASGSMPFADVPGDKFFFISVSWAVGEGITNGTDTTHFSPNNTCTRAQIVAMLYRGR